VVLPLPGPPSTIGRLFLRAFSGGTTVLAFRGPADGFFPRSFAFPARPPASSANDKFLHRGLSLPVRHVPADVAQRDQPHLPAQDTKLARRILRLQKTPRRRFNTSMSIASGDFNGRARLYC
jgi:hypothetical protein